MAASRALTARDLGPPVPAAGCGGSLTRVSHGGTVAGRPSHGHGISARAALGAITEHEKAQALEVS